MADPTALGLEKQRGVSSLVTAPVPQDPWRTGHICFCSPTSRTNVGENGLPLRLPSVAAPDGRAEDTEGQCEADNRHCPAHRTYLACIH